MPEWTHKGWFLLCPIYLCDVETDCPTVDERHWSLAPLMWLSEVLFFVYAQARLLVDPEAELEFPLFITGEM